MPFEEFKEFKGPLIPSGEKGEKERPKIEEAKHKEKPSELEEFSDQEIREIIDVVDVEKLSPGTLSKINIENIDSILDFGAQEIAEERQKENEKFKNLEEGMKQLSNASSSHHKLLCAVNGKEDFKTFYGTIEKSVEEKKIEETDDRVLYLKETTNRQIEICRISEELFKIDIKRRIGDLKKDNSFFLKSIPQIENLTPQIKEILEYFKKEEIQTKSKEIEDLTRKGEVFLNLIKDGKTDVIKDQFYKFCLNLSQLRLIDFEDLNEEKMKNTIKELVESQNKNSLREERS